MSSTQKLGFKPLINDHLGRFDPYNSGTESNDIGIVVFP